MTQPNKATTALNLIIDRLGMNIIYHPALLTVLIATQLRPHGLSDKVVFAMQMPPAAPSDRTWLIIAVLREARPGAYFDRLFMQIIACLTLVSK